MHNPEPSKMRAHARKGYIFLELAKFTIIALLIITPFRFFVAQPFIVNGASMAPTLDSNEYLVVDQLTYRFEKPQRGDIIIFRYPLDPAIFFVKRIIGLPGESVDIENGVVLISSTDRAQRILTEPYLPPGSVSKESVSMTLDDNEYFVLGDNRHASSDSRTWGPLSERFIVGRALMRLFPVHEVGFFPGTYRFPDYE